MSDLFLHPDLVRFAFVVGIVFSVVSYETRYLTTGGVVVPGYIALSVFLPYSAPVILVVALMTYFIVHVAIARVASLTAPARFSVTAVISAALHLVIDGALVFSGAVEPTSPMLRSIGYVVPGLIAHDFARHGIWKTSANILLTSLQVFTVLLVAALALPETGRLFASPREDALLIDLTLLPLLIFFSLIAWLGLARFRNLRCGGFLGAAYVTLLVPQPSEILFFLAATAATAAIVRYAIAPHAILFGRRQFAAYLLVGGCLSWILLKVREVLLVDYTISVVTPSLAVIGVLLTGLFAFDLERAGLARLSLGTAIGAAFTFASVYLVIELMTFRRPEVVLPFLAISCFAALVMFVQWPRPTTGRIPSAWPLSGARAND